MPRRGGLGRRAALAAQVADVSSVLKGAGLAGWLLAVPAAVADETPPAAAEPIPADAAAAAAPGAQSDSSSAPQGPQRTPRERYNAGLEHLAAGDHEAAAEAFLAARDAAGPDPELRYRAAFNLGLALAAGAGDDPFDGEASGTDEIESRPRALEALRRSAAWFADAVRLAPPGDDDARINLELVSRRILELADRLRGADRLVARLERLIDDQRAVRDRLRRLLAEVESEGAAAEPQGFRHAYDELGSRERALMADVGDGIDAAEEERLFIEGTPEDERSPEQRLRAWQLAALGTELERARQSLGDARRKLRRLEGERGHRRADAALADLKRARERLLDPVTVLGSVARDQIAIAAHTAVRAAAADDAPGNRGPPPGWLTNAHLAQRQEDAASRADQVLARFEAAASAPADATPGDGPDPETQRALRAAAGARPVLARAVGAMRDAGTALAAENPDAALPAQRAAVDGLREAIELFAGVRQLIELAHGDQRAIVGILDADADSDSDSDATDGPASGDPTEAVLALAADNTRRLARLEALLEEERTVTASGGGKDEGEEPERAVEERYRHAETLRARALEGLRDLAGEAASIADGGAGARDAANATLAALDELRRIFFSIVEHLQALRSDQAETHDRTATLQFERFTDIDALAAELALVGGRQREHRHLAAALAEALAEQADATGEAGAQGAPGAAPDAPKRFAEAAGEVRLAAERMHGAGARLADAATRAASPMLEPALEDQVAAIEHLENALAALAPPDGAGEPPREGEEGRTDQARAAEDRAGGDEPMSRRQALKRLQAIRDREAERQRRRASPGHEPVEKDW
ncbi:MAG: hypothetical protein OXC01_04940 [Immundisolibacterales bacterium]|nr:hypothetical protein [Immundisolibacterales bacterium]